MKVRELLAILQSCDLDTDVIIDSSYIERPIISLNCQHNIVDHHKYSKDGYSIDALYLFFHSKD